jgi:crotonobetainyl-CoA:carnitine CoA-transferase CaiB-like acyl-CoA transferase
MVMADLGADVIRVEPPGGSAARQRGPFLPDAPETERSLQFFAYNRNKRSIAIDLASDAGRDELLALVAGADFVLESSPGGLLERHGIDFETLRSVQPRVVHTQVSAYGVDGPGAGRAASDLTIAAMGGPVSLQGVPGRPPVRVSVPQVWRHTGVEAAVASLMAHARMKRTGEAQHVDVSAQCAMTWTMLNGMGAAGVQGFDFERQGSVLQLGRMAFPLVFECADGHVVVIPTGELIQALCGWMIEDGAVDASWRDEDWASYDLRVLTGAEVAHPPEEVLAVIRRFLLPYTKRELFERALAIGGTIAPVNTVADLLAFPHLADRNFFTEVEVPDGRRARLPGAFIRTTGEAPEPPRRMAPRLDEHGDEIRRELRAGGRSPAPVPLASREASGEASGEAAGADASAGLPLAGLKVADFSWIGVGPISARCLADHGATVVRVESMARPDKLRLAGPFKGEMGIDTSQFFADMNSSKLGLSLNLKHPAAIEVAKKLIEWADVYIESFTPGAVDRMGLGYEEARRLNPDIIMMSTCLMGQSGPAAQMAGYGYHAGAVAGFYELTGWPDLEPAGPWMAYTDTVAPRFIASTLLAAIDHRQRTGEGRHIDGAQLEMGLNFLSPELLDQQLNGYQATRMGNRSRDAAPHGVYPCAGEDQWCAIAVETDAQWQGLRQALGDPAWAAEPDLETQTGRLARQTDLDARLEKWTRGLPPQDVMERALAAGVPAGVVQRSSDLLRDPQYEHRGFYRELEHAAMGPIRYAGHQFRIRGYDSGPRSAAPMLGQHSFEVLDEILGIEAERVAELMAEGAIE